MEREWRGGKRRGGEERGGEEREGEEREGGEGRRGEGEATVEETRSTLAAACKVHGRHTCT